MDDVERLSRGYWRPSPGSVYPLLEEMARDGVIRKGSDGRYALTSPAAERNWAPGRFGPRNVEEAVSELRGLVSYLEDLKSSRTEEFAKAAPAMKDALDRLTRLSG
jgi:DNA-binding PadR family transcriptional regulator